MTEERKPLLSGQKPGGWVTRTDPYREMIRDLNRHLWGPSLPPPDPLTRIRSYELRGTSIEPDPTYPPLRRKRCPDFIKPPPMPDYVSRTLSAEQRRADL